MAKRIAKAKEVAEAALDRAADAAALAAKIPVHGKGLLERVLAVTEAEELAELKAEIAAFLKK